MQFSQPIPVQGGQQQQQQLPVVFYPGVVNRNNNNGRVENYCWKQSNVLGVLQILIGIICFVCNSVSLGLSQPTNGRYGFTMSIIGYGFWNGFFVWLYYLIHFKIIKSNTDSRDWPPDSLLAMLMSTGCLRVPVVCDHDTILS